MKLTIRVTVGDQSADHGFDSVTVDNVAAILRAIDSRGEKIRITLSTGVECTFPASAIASLVIEP